MPLYHTKSVQAPRRRFSRAFVGALASLLVGSVACNPGNALRVQQPDNTLSNNLNTAAALPNLLAGTLSAFQIAYGGAADEGNGGHEGYINLSGIFTDELQDVETFPTRVSLDARQATPSNSTLKGFFIDLAQARALADKTDQNYNKFEADSDGHAVALAIGGYTYVLFAEMYCDGVPVSSLNDNGSITYGQPLTRNQLLLIAIQRFDSATTVATANGDATTLNLARVGLGRALLDSNDDAAAAAAVALVPVGYVFDIGASTNSATENNGVWNYSFNTASFSVSDVEGTNGLPFGSAGDPRAPSFNTGGVGSSGFGPLVLQLLYQTQSTPLALATGIEAQLIIAEHQQRTGGPYLATLNTLRATIGLAPLPAAGAAADQQNQIFSERAFWMYLTGHRLGDLRRLIRQYGRTQDTVFPIGTTLQQVPYGTDVNFAVSEDEANNPNFHGCLNRNA